MAQDLQLISECLEKAPFNRKVSILDLDGLNGQSALQFLNDVFAALDHLHAGSVADEEPQETALRFFTFLRLVRYPSPDDSDELSTWRQDVVEGRRRAIIPILLWIMRNLPMVQQRVYLAKYMVKIDVPPELRADAEINQICEEQDRLVAEFAVVHRTGTQLKADADIVNEYRQEIKDLRQQKEQTERRVADLLTRVRTMPGNSAEKEERMVLAHRLREERERCSKLMDKRTELLQLAPTQTERITRLKEYTTKMTNDWLEMTPEKLLKKLEDRLIVQRRAVSEVLPKVISDEKAAVSELRNLIAIPDFTDKSLNELRIKAQMLQTEVFNLSDKLRTASQGQEQAQMSVYRGQLDSATNRKRELASRNDAAYREIRELEKQLRDVKGMEGEEGVDGQSLSLKLMQSSEDYEKKQQSIKALEAERGNTIRSNAVLADENERIEAVLTEWEKRTGISPFISPEKTPGGAAWMKTGDVVALAEQVRMLEKKSALRRSEVQELLTELQPIRQKHKAQQDALAKEKSKLDQTAGGSVDINKELARLRQEVLDLEDNVTANQIQLQYAEVLIKRADEAKSDDKFVNSVTSAVKKETQRLQELRATVAEVKAGYAKNSQQAAAWRDLDLLFTMKAQHLQQDLEQAELRSRRLGSAESGRDRIVMG